ncbi:MAG: hypothetical protein U0169_00640 [Polyangiaceae bacterium]
MNFVPRRRTVLRLAFLAAATTSVACGPSTGGTGDRTPLADKWLVRAKAEYKNGEMEDAYEASKSALQASPKDAETRTVAAKLALTKLEFAEAIKLTEGLESPDAHAIRGRAHWFAGDIEQAADELDAMLKDPTVKDPWARSVSRLARQGAGRKPFTIEGALVTAVEMPQAGPILVVPVELDGENVLALVATANTEVIVDSNARKEPSWVNLRFGGKVEVKDVPALTQDLSGVSRQLGAPIKALLGINLLRHAHVTFDRRGDQFVVRKNEPVAPPDASRVPVHYVRGGGMLVRLGVSPKAEGKATLLVDSSSFFPLALEDGTWRQAGVDPASLRPEPSAPGGAVKTGVVPNIKFGAFDLPRIPAVGGVPMNDLLSNVDVDLAGVVGSGLLSLFRVTFGDSGRFVWLEADPTLEVDRGARETSPPAAPQTTSPAPSAPAAAVPATSNAPSPAPSTKTPKGKKP